MSGADSILTVLTLDLFSWRHIFHVETAHNNINPNQDFIIRYGTTSTHINGSSLARLVGSYILAPTVSQ